MTVTYPLLDAMESACGADFADSYLSGAVELDGALIPKTRVAWLSLLSNSTAMGVLKRLGISLLEPVRRGARREITDLTEAEYRYLTTAEKIRHHQMNAFESEMRAGPMWKKGKPAGPEELPASWHDNMALATHHHAEAKRLKEIVANARAA